MVRVLAAVGTRLELAGNRASDVPLMDQQGAHREELVFKVAACCWARREAMLVLCSGQVLQPCEHPRVQPCSTHLETDAQSLPRWHKDLLSPLEHTQGASRVGECAGMVHPGIGHDPAGVVLEALVARQRRPTRARSMYAAAFAQTPLTVGPAHRAGSAGDSMVTFTCSSIPPLHPTASAVGPPHHDHPISLFPQVGDWNHALSRQQQQQQEQQQRQVVCAGCVERGVTGRRWRQTLWELNSRRHPFTRSRPPLGFMLTISDAFYAAS
jgi:hypothetical protein